MSTASAETVHNHLGVEAVSMAHHQHVSEAERLKEQWRDFRQAGAVMYDVLLWQDLKWPALSLAWLPKTVWEQPPAVAAAEAAAKQRRQQKHEQQAAEFASQSDPQQLQQNQHPESNHEMDIDEVASAAAAAAACAEAAEATGRQQATRQQQLVQMPIGYHYLLVGGQTSGQGTATIDLYRVEVPGVVEQPLQRGQRVLMQAGDMQQVMCIPHGLLDVNRLAVMPQQPNIIATACDQPEVYLFDLRQHTVQEWSGHNGSSGEERSENEAEEDNGDQDSQVAGSSQHNSSASDSDNVAASDTDSSRPTEPPSPQAVLTGRTAGGFALEFNPQQQGVLLGGDSGGGVQLWDIAAATSSGSGSSSGSVAQQLEPLQEVQGFAPCTINDLSWHRGGTAYALALENGQVWVQDLRAPASNGNSSASAGAGSSRSALGLTHFTGPGACKPCVGAVHVSRRRERRLQQLEQEGGQRAAQDCFCVAFDPLHDYRLASGGADGHVKLLDMRRLDDPVEELSMHAGSVTSVVWSHTLPGLLASAGQDGAVLLWDANKLQHADAFACHQQQQQQGLGLPQPPHLAREGLTNSVREYSLPGLLFMHGAHLGSVGWLALNADRPWLAASSTGDMVEAEDKDGRSVIQRQPVMVWEPNRTWGLLC